MLYIIGLLGGIKLIRFDVALDEHDGWSDGNRVMSEPAASSAWGRCGVRCLRGAMLVLCVSGWPSASKSSMAD